MKTIKPCVRSIPDQEFRVRAMLDDLSAVKHNDAVREANSREAMSNDEGVWRLDLSFSIHANDKHDTSKGYSQKDQ